MTYTNGKIPVSELVRIQSGMYLTPLAADSWFRVVAAVQKRFGWTPVVTDAYRTYVEQVRIFTERYVVQYIGNGYYNDVRYWNGVRYVRKPGTAAAAVPGTSNHGNATAVDVTGLGGFGATKYEQFALAAINEGWSNLEGRSVNEAWHWTKNSASFINNPSQGGGGSVPVVPPVKPIDPLDPITPEEITMEMQDTFRLIRRKGDGAVLAKDMTSGDVRLVTLAAYETLQALAILHLMWFKSGNGGNLDNMDPAPFEIMARFIGYTGPV